MIRASLFCFLLYWSCCPRRYVPEGESAVRFYSETVFFVVVTALVSIVLPELSDVIGIIGSTFATLQVFIFPALLVRKLYAREKEGDEEDGGGGGGDERIPAGKTYAEMQLEKMPPALRKQTMTGL